MEFSLEVLNLVALFARQHSTRCASQSSRTFGQQDEPKSHRSQTASYVRAAAKAKISKAAKAQWPKFRSEKPALGHSVVRKTKQIKKRVLSAAGRAKISKAAEARWAKVRAQAKKSVRQPPPSPSMRTKLKQLPTSLLGSGGPNLQQSQDAQTTDKVFFSWLGGSLLT